MLAFKAKVLNCLYSMLSIMPNDSRKVVILGEVGDPGQLLGKVECPELVPLPSVSQQTLELKTWVPEVSRAILTTLAPISCPNLG